VSGALHAPGSPLRLPPRAPKIGRAEPISATFDPGTRERRTRRSRQLITENRLALRAAEQLSNKDHSPGQPTPAPIAPTVDDLAALRENTSHGGSLTIQWRRLPVSDSGQRKPAPTVSSNAGPQRS
jgi:hypothetical protein